MSIKGGMQQEFTGDVPEARVRDQLKRMLANRLFASTPKASALLSYLIDETLAGRAAALNEQTIGEMVYKKASYDKTKRSDVRTGMKDLRRRLKDYYDESPNSAVRIEFPSRSFVPVFPSAIQTKGSGPSSQQVHHFRDDARPVSTDEAKVMVIRHDFYRSGWNETGKGIEHRYRRLILQGEIVVADDAAGLMWQRGTSSRRCQWGHDADEYIADLNAKKFAGFDDWRVPTLEELMSLVTAAQTGIPFTRVSATEIWSPGEPSRWEEVEVQSVVHLDPLFEKADALWTADAAPPVEVDGNLLERGWAVGFWDGFCFPELVDRNYDIKAVRSITD